MPRRITPRPEPAYKEVRVLTRGLELLKALNARPGGFGTVSDLARACGMHRTTAKRLLETLCLNGFVRAGARDGLYYLTFEVRRLSEGFEDEAWIERVARPMMRDAVGDLLWPCDIATFEGGDMVVRESTHRLSPLSQQHAMIGEKLPIFETATGRAYFSFSEPDARDAMLRLLVERGRPEDRLATDRRHVDRIVRTTRRRGFGLNDGEWPRYPAFSGIAVPIRSGDRLIAALNMGFPVGSLSLARLRGRFVPMLRALADGIGDASRPWLGT